MHGVIDLGIEGRRTDYLFRVTIKAFVVNEDDEILVVKEKGRGDWDLPGGGLDHDETIASGLTRELKEEVDFEGCFTHHIIDAEGPQLLESKDLLQIRIVAWIEPEQMNFSAGEDGDEMAFLGLEEFRDNPKSYERFKRYLKSVEKLRS